MIDDVISKYTRNLLQFYWSLWHFAYIIFFFQAKKKEQESEQDWDNWFSEQDKELQQIFQGQSAMREVLTDLHRKMDEIITRQERTLTLVQQVIWLFV